MLHGGQKFPRLVETLFCSDKSLCPNYTYVGTQHASKPEHLGFCDICLKPTATFIVKV